MPFARLLSCICLASTVEASKPVPARRVHSPPRAHVTLSPDPKRQRTIIVGDVHGCLDELRELLTELLKLDPKNADARKLREHAKDEMAKVKAATRSGATRVPACVSARRLRLVRRCAERTTA